MRLFQMTKLMLLAIVIIIMILASCSVREDRIPEPVFLSGEQIDIGSEETLFEIVYANDTVLVAHLLSDLRKLKIYNQRHPGDSYEFLHIGRGPFEVNQCAVKSRADTLYAMSYTPVGIQGVITIPVCRTDDKSAWRYEDISEAADVPMGGDFDVLQGQYIVLGDKYGQPNILSSITRGVDISVTPLSWWPQDKYNGSIISKQALYMNASKIFASGSKIVYACSEGRYVSILDFSSGTPAEKLIYGEFPVYKAAPDGMNAIRSPKSRRGVYAFATDSLIYISPLEYMIEDGRYVPANYKGYPPYYNDRIEVYDWDGDCIATYILDRPFYNFYVRDDDKSLYALTVDRETMYSEIYRYCIGG